MARLAGTLGILAPAAVGDRFHLDRFSAAADLQPFVENFWLITWDLTGQPPHIQDVLPFPNVHAIVEQDVSSITGVMTGRFTRHLTGIGQAFGIKFRCGGFHPFLRAPVATLTNRRIDLGTFFGVDARQLERDLSACPTVALMAGQVETLLRAQQPVPDELVDLVDQVVQHIATPPRLLRVEEVAAAFDLSQRRLQRLFAEYVGVSPKWVIKRFRLHEAAERLATTPDLDAAQLAHELGYFDQAHFSRDFKQMVGRPPGTYARGL